MHNLIAAAGARGLRRILDGHPDAELRARHDDFLPAHEYIERAGLTIKKPMRRSATR